MANALGRATVHCQKDPERPAPVKDFIATIPTTDDVPFVAKPRKYNDIQRAFLKHKIRIMRRRAQLEDATGGYSSALVLVPYQDRIQAFTKKHGAKAAEEMWKEEHEKEVSTFFRLTQDLRELNQKTIADLYPLPRIDYLLDQVKMGTDHFSIADLADAFWCVPLAKQDRHKTAFRTPYDHVQSTVMVQGAKNSANMWARVAAATFARMASEEAIVYQDDVLGHSRSFEEHFWVLDKLYDCLEQSGLTFKLAKCHFDYPSVVFLGHCIDKDGRYPSKKAVEAIVELAYPCNDQTEVRSFIGMTLYYKDYIRNYSDIVAPLHALTRKGVDVKSRWKEEHKNAVDQLKQALAEAPCLQIIDNSKPFQIRVDACRKGRGLGAILLQPYVHDETKWVPVAYWSKGLRAAEREYSPTELECKALHDSILHWDVYLQSARSFDVYTDHNALLYMVKGQTATNNGRLMRYLMDIQGYSFNLYYREGKYHLDADGVSRLLQRGETPVYWTADDLEDDKGIPTEEDILWARDQAAKRTRRSEAAMARKTKINETSQQDLLDQILTSQDGTEEVVEADRTRRKEIRRQQKLIAEIVEDAAKISQGIGDSIVEPSEAVHMVALCAAHKRGGRRGVSKGEVLSLNWVRKLRDRTRKVDYQQTVYSKSWREDVATAEKSEVERVLENQRRAGYSRLRVLPSTIEGAGNGLFARTLIKEKEQICDYRGETVSQEDIEREDFDKTYVFSWPVGDTWMHVDAKKEDSGFGRFINDPRDETKVNARITRRGNKLVVVATTEILPGEEIFIDYGYEYWLDRMECLSVEQKEAVQEAMRKGKSSEHVGDGEGETKENGSQRMSPRKGISPEKSQQTQDESKTSLRDVSNPSLRDVMARESSKVGRATKVRKAVKTLTEEQQDRYVFDNVFQCPELAEELQYLVGRRYIDDENGVLYQVSEVGFMESARAVVGYRRAMDGKAYKYDDDPFHVFGAMGLLQLTELYDIDREDEETKWPETAGEWAKLQWKDEKLKELMERGQSEGEKEWVAGRDIYRVHQIDKADVLFRKNTLQDRVVWQKMVPSVLQDRVVKMFHEGYGHPGAARALETVRLHYYWEGQREQVTSHCRECLGCQLRNAYTRKPKIPVQAYPDVWEPMGRVHIDLTGPFRMTEGGNTYILVVKDFISRYVWLFAIPDKSSERIAQILLNQLFAPFGAPRMLVSDRGREFTNRINKRLSQLFRVNRVSTTPYNPRANGLVEQHNATLKSQLYHYVNVKQSDWDKFLPTVQLMYNSTVCPSTGYTPNFMMFGREFSTPDVVVPEETLGGEDVTQGWLEKMTKALGIAWDTALIKTRARVGGPRESARNTLTIQEVNRESNVGVARQRDRSYKEFKEGDRFFRKRNPVRTFKSASDRESYKLSLKLQARYEGPYKVKQRVNAVVFVADIDGEDVRVHAVNMKPAVG